MTELISPEQRATALDHIGYLLRLKLIDADSFAMAKSRFIGAATNDELAIVMAALPSPIQMTPPPRRLTEALVLDASASKLERTAQWQLGRETIVRSSTGHVLLDLRAAEFDDLEVDLELECRAGMIDVIVPVGVEVQILEARTAAKGVIQDRLKVQPPACRGCRSSASGRTQPPASFACVGQEHADGIGSYDAAERSPSSRDRSRRADSEHLSAVPGRVLERAFGALSCRPCPLAVVYCDVTGTICRASLTASRSR